jgi:hypothetical protein
MSTFPEIQINVMRKNFGMNRGFIDWRELYTNLFFCQKLIMSGQFGATSVVRCVRGGLTQMRQLGMSVGKHI